ncbi:MATE family efflux transporter [Clostridium sp. M62/1]|uniref:MATE family efflux transporter n=1 Tax=Clostridium sp. M62/1 TaxID=411486 RepID=UPI003567F0B8
MNYKELFSKTPPTKLFFTAAIPGSIGMLASALYQTIDGVLVGRILSGNAFAALNLAMPLVIINFSLADLIGVGSAVPISVRLGEKKESEANNIFTSACLMIVITGLILGLAIFLAAPALIGLMGAEGELARLAVQYLRVYCLCSPVTTIVFAMDNYLKICGRVRSSMALNIVMSVLSAVLEFIFLFMFRFGIWAAALATCTGMFLCALSALYPFLRRKMQLRFVRPRLNRTMIKTIVTCGSPNFLNNVAGRITSIIMNMILLRVGGATAVSVYGILMFADGFVQPLLYGMCDSLQPAVGYNWGAGALKRVKAIEKRCFTAGAILSIASAVVIFCFPLPIASLFTQNADQALLDMAVPALKLFSSAYLIRWFSFAAQSYMSAVEKPVPAMIISVCTAVVFPLLIIAVLWPLGLNGLWLNVPATSLLAAILAFFILNRFERKEMREAAR